MTQKSLFPFIPFLLLAVPILEIGVFIIVGGQIGVLNTLLGVLLTAVIGTILLRQQGFALDRASTTANESRKDSWQRNGARRHVAGRRASFAHAGLCHRHLWLSFAGSGHPRQHLPFLEKQSDLDWHAGAILWQWQYLL